MERTGHQRKRKKRSEAGSKKFIDYTLLLIIVCILGFGLVMLYSTSAYNATLKYGNSIYYLKKQVIAACMGFAVMYFCIKVVNHFFARFAGIAYLAATILVWRLTLSEAVAMVRPVGSISLAFPFSHLSWQRLR